MGQLRDAAGIDDQHAQGGADPHGSPRKTPAAQLQKSEHLRIDGTIVDTCEGGPCHSLP